MILNKKTSVQGDYAKIGEDIHDGDLLKVLDEGATVSGDYGDRTAFHVLTKNGEKVLSFNQTSVNNLIDAFGQDTKGWIGKEVKSWIVKQMIDKKLRNIVYLTASDWVMSDDGQFLPSLKNTEARNGSGDIADEDLPF